MPNYQNGKIYSLRSHQTDDIYIGSTTQSLAVRKAGHRDNYKKHLNGKYPFTTSFNIIKFDDCYIELMENYQCNSRNELERREGQLIREMDCVNKNIAGRTPKEYRDDNKEVIAERGKEYYEENKEVIKERGKKYREANKEKLREKHTCECGGKYTLKHKSTHAKSKKHQAYMDANV